MNAPVHVASIDDAALRLHAAYRGKIQTIPKCPIRGLGDFALLYTPGVAAPCRKIEADPEAAYTYTNKGNTVAVVSDGSRVLGLGNIGPLAGLPVMEGKALLFKYLGGIDAVPLCLHVSVAHEIVRTVQAITPSFGGINLEDIAQPKCFRILDDLRRSLDIPVWHDDQQGTATVTLGALLNALKVAGKDLHQVQISLIGIGAANMSTYHLLKAVGVDPGAIVACDSKGVLHVGRSDIEANQAVFPEKWRVCRDSNAGRIQGGIPEALCGADVCIAFSQSGPSVIRPEWIRGMAPNAIVFACANPIPEIWPSEAMDAGAAIMATGRSDFPNQVNNSLAFPGIFRGVLDVRARTISDEMAIAAAHEIAACVGEKQLAPKLIVPAMDDFDVAVRVATATGLKAQEQGLARLTLSRSELRDGAAAMIRAARQSTTLLHGGPPIQPAASLAGRGAE